MRWNGLARHLSASRLPEAPGTQKRLEELNRGNGGRDYYSLHHLTGATPPGELENPSPLELGLEDSCDTPPSERQHLHPPPRRRTAASPALLLPGGAARCLDHQVTQSGVRGNQVHRRMPRGQRAVQRCPGRKRNRSKAGTDAEPCSSRHAARSPIPPDRDARHTGDFTCLDSTKEARRGQGLRLSEAVTLGKCCRQGRLGLPRLHVALLVFSSRRSIPTLVSCNRVTSYFQ